MTDLLTPAEPFAPAPEPKASRRWMTPGAVAVGLLLLGFLLILTAGIRVQYLATSPGPVTEVHGIIEVEGAETFEPEGELFFLTISRPSDPLTLLELFEAWRDPAVDIVLQTARTGKFGDGKVFVTALEDVVRIRTGERGEDAV